MAYLWVFMVLVAAQEQTINTRNYQEVTDMWPASGEHIYTDCVCNIRRQRTILYLDVRY